MKRPAAAIAVAVIIGAVLLGFVPVLATGFLEGVTRGEAVDPYVLRVVWFTLLQAGLSTLLSVGLAIPVARALTHGEFAGRWLLLRLFALPLALPAIVAILGIVEVYGRTGWLSRLTGHPIDLYGLGGILLAHVFFNLPLAIRLHLQRLEAISPESQRLAEQLGFDQRARWWLLEWPALRTGLAGTASLIFILCAASFAVVLTLGGGPHATTLEVAIYMALRFDYDPARAPVLALAQLVLCTTFVLAAARHAGSAYDWPSLRGRRAAIGGAGLTGGDRLLITSAATFVALPIAAIVVAGITADFDGPAITGATLTSLAIAATAACLGLLLAWPLSGAIARSRTRQSSLALLTLLPLIMPPAVLATGWFIIANRAGLPLSAAPLLVVAMNALMALPFTTSVLTPAVRLSAAQNDRLCASLGLAGMARWRIVDWPVLAVPLGLAAAMAFIVSLGDLTAITLFGSQGLMTLPALIYSQMGNYRIDAAAGTALVLGAMSLALISLFERLAARR